MDAGRTPPRRGPLGESPATTGTDRTTAACLVVSALALMLVSAAIIRLHIDHVPGAASGRANLAALGPYWAASAVAWTALTALWLSLRARTRDSRRPLAAAITVCAVALAARAIVLVGHDAQLSDDVHRYVFDGRNLAHGHNPYLVRPVDRREARGTRWPGELATVARMNNIELVTIYLPTSQWAFAATALVMPDRVADPDAAARWQRGAMTLFETALIAVLIAVVVRAGRSPWWVALYAWHPLPLTEIAGSGHQEPLGLLLVATALAAACAPRARAGHGPDRPGPVRDAAAFAALAAAALVKPVAAAAALLLLARRRWPRWLAAAAIGAVVTLAVAGPLLLAADGAAFANLRETAARFSLKWAHFGSVYEPVLWSVERLRPGPNDPQERLARIVCAAAAAVAWLVIALRRSDPWRGLGAMMLAALLLAPVVHPWYVLWALIVMPIAPSRAIWIASLTIPWSYAAWGYVEDGRGGWRWGVGPWTMVVAYAPIYASLLWTAWGWRGRRRLRAR